MKTLKIHRDIDAENPRDWDNHCQLICWHSHYNLGDEHKYDRKDFRIQLACEVAPEIEGDIEYLNDEVFNYLFDRAKRNGCDTWRSQVEYAADFVKPRIDALVDKALEGYIIKPVYMYDHGNITLNTTGFGCQWDSGQVGYAVVTAETVKKKFESNYGLAEKVIDAEVKIYSQFVGGDVYGYVVEDEEGDSCWGFYGSDPCENGMEDHLEGSIDDYEVVYA